MKNKKNIWVIIAAAVAAIVGAAVAVAMFFKKKAEAIGEQLDYDPELIDEEVVETADEEAFEVTIEEETAEEE